ncbi:MAG: chitobiase/beta-hexosaminidase C-terminal domain-containing protein [Lachnospiraceae bacterium]|nr:chitobiase/beta-hexosaminidase C-terminal domain-containing protein [Lachnospiraceae bacterium]
MKCPNCGARLKDGNLFCEVCGEEINIVPDYDPDADLAVDVNSVFDRTKEIDTEAVKKHKNNTPKKSDYYSHNKHVSGRSKIDTDDDFEDEEVGEISAFKDAFLSIIDFWNRSIFTKIVFIFCILLLIALVLGFTFVIRKIHDRTSVGYLVEQAENSYRNKDFDTAIDYYDRALEKDPDNSKIKFAMANCYLSDGQDKNAIFILKEIAIDNPELATDTYERIFNIYFENQDYAGINDMLLTCNNPETVNKFREYLCEKPSFSAKDGEYDDFLYLELNNANEGEIYYTLDGTDPTKDSSLYTDPIYLESGDYDVRAIFVSQYDVVSEIGEGKFTINVTIPLAPQVSIESGSYNVPILIKVESDINCETYYVCYRANVKQDDRVDPDKEATLYEYPLIMPMGPSEFRFISYSEEGVPSTIITRKYNVTIPDATVSMVEGANIATLYRYALGGLTDTDGHISTTNGKFEYIIEDALNMKGTIYYVINEYYVDSSNAGKRTLTGMRVAVNTTDPNDYGTLDINAKGEYYIIKETNLIVDGELMNN